jgi:hypothetical protein
MQTELEGGDDTEVTAAATERPEQFGLVRLATDYEAAVGRDHVGGDEVVARQSARSGR